MYVHIHAHITVDFVLKDPRQKEQGVAPPKLSHRQELEVVPKPWNQTFLAAAETMSEVLSVTNPTVAAVLKLWYQEYTHHRWMHTCMYTQFVHICTYIYMYMYVHTRRNTSVSES